MEFHSGMWKVYLLIHFFVNFASVSQTTTVYQLLIEMSEPFQGIYWYYRPSLQNV